MSVVPKKDEVVPLLYRGEVVGQAVVHSDRKVDCFVVQQYLQKLKKFMGPGDGLYNFQAQPKDKNA